MRRAYHYMMLHAPELGVEKCECDWVGRLGEVDFSCGCGAADVRPYRDDCVHWRGKHWTTKCALVAALKELDGRVS